MARKTTKSSVRAIVYVRQSVSREESISLEVQETACREYAQRRGYQLVGDCLRDPGVSGLEFERRPGIRQALELVENGEAEVIIVYRWSRLSRRRIDQAVILNRVGQARARVECATETFENTAAGEFGRDSLLNFAVFESRLKSEQWREAQERRRKRGLPAGGAPPFGYTKPAKAGEAFVPDPVLGAVLAEMYADYLRGHGYQAIARSLNARGYRSPRGNELRVVTVQRILDSGFGAGYLRHGVNTRDQSGRRIEQPIRMERGAHEPVIDERTWRAYERERDRRRVVHPKSRQPRWHLGGGLTVCGKCGANLIVNTYDGAKSQAICSAYKSKRTCDGVWMNRNTLEVAVAVWLGGHVDAWANAQDELRGTDAERATLATDLDAAQHEEQRIADGLSTAARLVASGAMSEQDYLDARREADARRFAASQTVIDLQRQLDALNPDADAYRRILRGSEGESPQEWNAILKRVIKSVKVLPKRIVIEPVRGKTVEIDATTVMPRTRATTDDAEPWLVQTPGTYL